MAVSSLDYTLEALLDLDGETFIYPSGHWRKIKVRKLLCIDQNFPHGIKYSLTLHAPNGARILGYDNAHATPGESADIPFDHIHKKTRVVSYSYQNAAQLLADFFSDVKVILEFEKEHEYEI